jgi:hypothetical protein
VEDGDHLVVAELLRLVGTAVPDLHRPGAVLALRDLAVEVQVLEGMVLGAHRQPVLVGMVGDPPRDRPGGQRPFVLQAQVPVKARGVVLLDHEPEALRPGVAAARGLGGLGEVAFLSVRA